jgi:hypothetical protein
VDGGVGVEAKPLTHREPGRPPGAGGSGLGQGEPVLKHRRFSPTNLGGSNSCARAGTH